MTFGLITGILLLLAMIAAGVYMWYKGLSFDQLVAQNVAGTFKFLSAASTGFEVVGLTSIAIQSGRMDWFNALSRYSTLGLFEAIFSFLFISSFSESINKLLATNRLGIGNIFMTIVWSLPFFFLSFFVTSSIHFLYLESINWVETHQRYASWFTSLFYVNITTNPSKFLFTLPEQRGRIEAGALMMIYATQLISICLCIVHLFNNRDKIQLTLYVKATEPSDKNVDPDPNAGTASNPVNTGNNPPNTTPTTPKIDLGGGLNAHIKEIEEIFGISAADFQTWLYELIGLDLGTKKTIQTTITHADVISGKMNPSTLLSTISNKIVGTGTTGLTRARKCDNTIKTYLLEADKLRKEFKDKEEKLNLMKTDPSNPKVRGLLRSTLETDMNNLKKELETKQKNVANIFTDKQNELETLKTYLTKNNLKVGTINEDETSKAAKAFCEEQF